jgi:hypothetical protein
VEPLRVERVEANRESLQTGLAQGARVARQQAAVGGERQVLDARDAHQARHQFGQPAAQQGLTPGQAQLAHTGLREGTRDALDLVEIQPTRAVADFVLRIAILRHAVRTAEIAGLDHRNAQVAQRALQPIQRRHADQQGVDRARHQRASLA